MGASFISMHHRRLFFVKENFAEQRQRRERSEQLIEGGEKSQKSRGANGTPYGENLRKKIAKNPINAKNEQKKHFFCILWLKNLEDCKNYCTFAPLIRKRKEFRGSLCHDTYRALLSFYVVQFLLQSLLHLLLAVRFIEIISS